LATLGLPDNISLLFLPPYSPELNPKENLWDEIREKIFIAPGKIQRRQWVMYDGLRNPKSKWTTVNSQHRRQIQREHGPRRREL
jgi:hypothetical protein